MTKTISPQNLKHLLSDPLQEKFADFCTKQLNFANEGMSTPCLPPNPAASLSGKRVRYTGPKKEAFLCKWASSSLCWSLW